MLKIFKGTPLAINLILLGSISLILIGTIGIVSAHIVREEPWHPVASAYLRSTFYLNLNPQINWSLIEQEYESMENSINFSSVYEALEPVEAMFEIELTDPIKQAIINQDTEVLHAISTKAISLYTRYFIAEAASKLDEPGAADQDVKTAQQIYRVFGQNFLRNVDPAAFQTLGRAWLDMSSSVGSAGVGGIGAVDTNTAKFIAAQSVIEDYLIANYEVDVFPARDSFAPIPALLDDVSIPIWLPPGSNLNDQNPLPLLRLNFEAQGFEESDIPLVAYGDMLFDSPEIFGDPGRTLGVTCSMCHNRSDINRDFFIPGVSHQAGSADVDGAFFNPFFNDQRSDSLDIPSLRGLRFTAPYGRDGRFASLREFTRNVIINEFAGEEPTPFMLDALVAYMLEFDFLPSPYLNGDGTLNATASESAKRGEILFNTSFEGMQDNTSCASCHLPSSHFTDGQTYNIGSGGVPSAEFAVEGFFETPTLLNAVYTPPYFHDGILESLEDVVRWKDQAFDMKLTDDEIADLTEYLIAIGTAEEPWEIFDDENTVFALQWAELTTFATTLDTMLIPKQDTHHALLLIDTVAPDMRVDASGLQDLSHAPLVFEVADKLDEIKSAILDNDWANADQLYDEYEALVEEYTSILK